jgi:hypothetical protein
MLLVDVEHSEWEDADEDVRPLRFASPEEALALSIQSEAAARSRAERNAVAVKKLARE